MMGLFALLLLWQLLLHCQPNSTRRHSVGLSVVVCLLLSAVVYGGEAELSLLRGILLEERGDYSGAMRCYGRGAELSAHEDDRLFARSLELECARLHGMEASLLERWRVHGSGDPVLVSLLCQESGDGYALSKVHGRHPLASSVHAALLCGHRDRASALLREYITTHGEDASGLSGVVSVAENGAFHAEAELALQSLGRLSSESLWQSRFRLLKLCLSRGDAGRGLGLVRRWSADVHGEYPAGVLHGLGDFSERLGDSALALSLYDREGSEESAIRGAMLLEALKRPEEAMVRWRRIASGSKNVMRKKQAFDRIIALAKEMKTLEALCAETGRDLSSKAKLVFHVKALRAAKRYGELFALLERRGELEMAVEYRIARKQYLEAADLLNRIIKKHPERKEYFLQQLTVIALECGSLSLADKVLSELLEVSPDQEVAREYAAGVYARLGAHDKALACYDACLKERPDKVELLLLRANALKKLGRQQEAIGFFLGQLVTADDPNRFGVMVDGMLNMEAGRHDLQAVLALVMKRVEAHPEVLFYYRLAEDVAEELSDWHTQRLLLKRQLAVAPERRGLVLRTLYELSQQRGERREALYFTRLLVRLRDIHPPALYRSMARTLIENGDFPTAEQCMRRADEAEGGIEYRTQLVSLAMELNLLDAAWRINQELMVLTPKESVHVARAAVIEELRGHYREAAALNLRCLQLMIGRAVSRRHVSGGSDAMLRRAIRPVLAAFCNQAVVLGAGAYAKRIQELCQGAVDESQRRLWAGVLRRLHDLTSLAVVSVDGGERQPRPRPLSFYVDGDSDPLVLGESLAVLPSSSGVSLVRDYFRGFGENEKSDAWVQLVSSLRAEPCSEVKEELRSVLSRMKVRPLGGSWSGDPWCYDLKLRYAEKLRQAYPRRFDGMVLHAVSLWWAGQEEASRQLVPDIQRRFLDMKSYDYNDVQLLRELNVVYVSGAGESSEVGAASREAHLRSLQALTLGDGQAEGRAILLSFLHEGAGRWVEATQVLCEAWKLGCCDSTLLDLLREALRKSQQWSMAAEALSVRPHGRSDAYTFILYGMLHGQVLRRLGRDDEALGCYGSLPMEQCMQERLVNPAVATEERVFLLRRLLYRAVHGDHYITSLGYDSLASHGGDRRVMDIARKLPESRQALSYLLRGTLLTEKQFYPLLMGYAALSPSVPGNQVVEGEEGTVSGLLMKLVSAPEKLTVGEREQIGRLTLREDLSPDLLLSLMERLPGADHEGALRTLGARLVSLPFFHVQRDQVARLLRLCPDALPRNDLAERILIELTLRGDAKAFQVLSELRRWHSPLSAPVLAGIAKRRHAMSGATDAGLVFGSEPLAERCFRRIAWSHGSVPDWDAVRGCLSDEDWQAMLSSYEGALHRAHDRGMVNGEDWKSQLTALRNSGRGKQ